MANSVLMVFYVWTGMVIFIAISRRDVKIRDNKYFTIQAVIVVVGWPLLFIAALLRR